MRWLIVGAGAVGQVMAAHAQRGGAEVAFKVRDIRRVHRPFRVLRLGIGRAPRASTFDAPVFERDEDVGAFSPDLVLLTVPSNVLTGSWLSRLLAAAPGARIVAMEPGAEDAAVIAAAAPGRPLTRGIVAFIAYQSPLPTDPDANDPDTQRAIAYWAPRFGPCPFEGPDAAAVVTHLRAGGLAAGERRGLGATASYGSAVMALYIGALRLSGWSLRTWRTSPHLARAGQAVREAARTLADTGPAPLWLRWLTPTTVRAGMFAAERVLPLPLEAYLEYHFTKVSAQSFGHIERLVERAERLNVPAPALRELWQELAAAGGADHERETLPQ